MKTAEPDTEASTNRSPATLEPAPPAPATRPTPASASAYPPHSDGRAMPSPLPAVISATSTGTAPTTSAAWLTLVRSMPAFCSRITAP